MGTVVRRSSGRKRGTGSVYRRADGYWMGEVWIGGSRHRLTAKTEELAGLRLDELLRNAGAMPYAEWDGKTVGSWLRYWLTQAKVQPVTLFGYNSIVENHLAPVVGHLRLTELKPAHVRGLLSTLGRQGRRAGTLRNVRNCLSAALEMAREDGHLITNPARVKVSDPNPRTRVTVSQERMSQILDAVEHHRYGALYYTLLYTGLRVGEATALYWSDLDWRAQTLTVRRTVTREPLPDNPRRSRKIIGESTKTGRDRTIVLAPQLIMKLRSHHWAELLRLGLPHDAKLWREPKALMFPAATNRTRPLDSTHALHAFQSALEGVGLRGSDGGPMRLHECRHLLATWMLGAGTDVSTVSRYLGHSTPTTTMRFYAGVVQGADIVAAQKIAFFEPSTREQAAAKAAIVWRQQQFQPAPSRRTSHKTSHKVGTKRA